MLEELHWEHPGISAMKAIPHSCVWWPKMGEEIKRKITLCSVCENVQLSPPKAPWIPWKWTMVVYSRWFLPERVVVDSFSKWIELRHMTSITTEKTIKELYLMFAQHGLPEEWVSDNGPQCVSNEFAEFMYKTATNIFPRTTKWSSRKISQDSRGASQTSSSGKQE